MSEAVRAAALLSLSQFDGTMRFVTPSILSEDSMDDSLIFLLLACTFLMNFDLRDAY